MRGNWGARRSCCYCIRAVNERPVRFLHGSQGVVSLQRAATNPFTSYRLIVQLARYIAVHCRYRESTLSPAQNVPSFTNRWYVLRQVSWHKNNHTNLERWLLRDRRCLHINTHTHEKQQQQQEAHSYCCTVARTKQTIMHQKRPATRTKISQIKPQKQTKKRHREGAYHWPRIVRILHVGQSNSSSP